MHDLWIKDESQLPTGSFKSRGHGRWPSAWRSSSASRRVAIPTAGNAGGAMAAYAARAGMEAFVFMPDDTPVINQFECRLAGAKTFLVNGLINDCGRIVREGKERMGWFDMSTLKEPYRLEGKKTMGLELAEQFELAAARRDPLSDRRRHGPDRHVEGVSGAGRARLAGRSSAARGWSPCSPTAVRRSCGPSSGASGSPSRFPTPHTIASGLRVPAAVGDFMMLDAIRASGGTAIAVEESRIREWMELGAQNEGIAICPEAAACIGALGELTEQQWIRPEERVVIFNTGAAQKYPEAMACDLPRIDKNQPLDWDRIERGR